MTFKVQFEEDVLKNNMINYSWLYAHFKDLNNKSSHGELFMHATSSLSFKLLK